MSPHPVSNEVLAVELGHLREEIRELRDALKEMQGALKVLSEERAGRRAIIGVLSLLGGGGIALVLRALMSP